MMIYIESSNAVLMNNDVNDQTVSFTFFCRSCQFLTLFIVAIERRRLWRQAEKSHVRYRHLSNVNYTVWFISFATFDDDVTPKVIKIIKFWKKSLKDKCLVFFHVQFLQIFEKNLMLLAYDEHLSIFGKKTYFSCHFPLNDAKRTFFSLCFHELYWISLIYN